MNAGFSKIKQGAGWLVAAALLLFACSTVTNNGVTPQAEVVVVTQIVVATPTPSGDTIAQSGDDAATPQPELELEVTITTPGFSPTRPLLPTPNPGPTQQPLFPGESDFSDEDIQLFFEVWQLVEESYDGNLPTDQELMDAVIAAALETLDDQFTLYLNAESAQRSREAFEGSYEGIGAFVEQNEEGYFVITRPIAGQPAALAGLKPGDIVLAADGEPLIGKTMEESIALVRGPEGSAVSLTILREDVAEPFEVTIVRQQIVIPVVEFEPELLEGDIAYVRLTSFNAQAYDQLNNALERLLAQEPRALILDLRDNPGGFLNQSILVADLFLPDGVVLYERNIRGLEEVYESHSGDLAEEIPLVVLVNPGSASASEIVAGAIQDRGRGIIIGETSFGKGSVQSVYTLSDGSELRVTIARWYTPNNQSISGAGITPDIEETPSPLEFGGPDDNQLQRAIEYILTGQ